MRYDADEDAVFVADRATTINGHHFKAPWRDDGQDVGEGGPWGTGGFTSRCLRRIAAQIREDQRGCLVFMRWPNVKEEKV